MSAGPASALAEAQGRSPQIASSAVVVGTARLGEGSLLAEGAVIRSEDAGVEIGTGSAVLENSVAIGNATIPTTIGRRTTFGHRSDGGGLEPVVPGRFDPRDLDGRTSRRPQRLWP
jgi:UDP-3-O-[3-hydroxymyristoyl] glucosamine N-acyltransferase